MRRMERWHRIVASWHRRCVARWRVDASRRPAFAISLTSNKMPRPQRQWCWRGKASCLTVACTSCCLKSDTVQAQPRPDQTRPSQAQLSAAQCSPLLGLPDIRLWSFCLFFFFFYFFVMKLSIPTNLSPTPTPTPSLPPLPPPCIRFSYQRRTFLS